MKRRRRAKYIYTKLFLLLLVLFIIGLPSLSFGQSNEFELSPWPHNRLLGDLHASKYYGIIDDATHPNLYGTFSSENLGDILEELGGGEGVASPNITLATYGTTGIDSYSISVPLPSGRRVVEKWPVFYVGGIAYPHTAVLQPGPQGSHLSINLYLDADEEAWNDLDWLMLVNLESVTILPFDLEEGQTITPLSLEPFDFHIEDINEF